MALQEFQVGLLTALPLRDALEVVDVPANECSEGWCALLDANECRGIFQHYFPMFCPGEGRRTVRKGPGLPMDNLLFHALTHDRGVADRAVRLPACFDRGHDTTWRRQADLVSFMSPPQTVNSPECPRIPQKRAT